MDVPLAHLLKEALLVFLALRPAHVEHVRLLDVTFDHVSHEIRSTMIVESAGKEHSVGAVPSEYFYPKASRAGVLAHENRKNFLMAARSEDVISHPDQHRKQIFGSPIVSDEVESRIRAVRCESVRPGPVILQRRRDYNYRKQSRRSVKT